MIGRTQEIEILEAIYNDKRSRIVVVYGRRRVGKSFLIKNFAKNKRSLLFEGLENEETSTQIANFSARLFEQTKNPLFKNTIFKTWDAIFSALTFELSNEKHNKKLVLFFDEFQWMCCQRSSLVSTLKFFWDNHWKDQKVMLILCGSIASFMVKKVIRSKALYGRIDNEICLKGLPPNETKLFFKKSRSNEEILKYQLIIDGIPKYYEMINYQKSFQQNLQELFFKSHTFFSSEYEKIFHSQFKEATTYLRIINLLKDKMLTLGEISKKLKLSNGGGLKLYLENLEMANFITSYVSWNKPANSKARKYKIQDEYLNFYFHFVAPFKKEIFEKEIPSFFNLVIKPKLIPWMGIAFERYCLKHAMKLAAIMGFADEVINFGPYFEKSDEGFQIDLLFHRADKVITVCEIKFHQDKIDTEVVKQLNDKIRKLDVPAGYCVEKALICLNGATPSLIKSELLDYIVLAEEILK